MKIAIIGGGALGSAYASIFSNSQVETILLVRREDQVSLIKKRGITIKLPFKTICGYPNITTDPSMIKDVDFVFVMTKSFDTVEAVRELKDNLDESTCFVSLQNGLGNCEALLKMFPKNSIIGGVSYFGVTKKSDAEIVSGENFNSSIGFGVSCSDSQRSEFIKLFEVSGLTVSIKESIDEAIWSKLLIIACQNALGAITNYTFGELKDSNYCLNIIKLIIEEISNVSQKCGIKIQSDPLKSVISNWESLPDHKPSMRSDIEKGKKTEIDFINGAIVKLGDEIGIPTQTNYVIANIVRMLEKE